MFTQKPLNLRGFATLSDRQAIAILVEAAGDYSPQLAQGETFAAKVRARADNLTEETESDVQLPVEVQWREREGIVRRESLLLSLGWHTLLLGETAKTASSSS